MTTCSADARPRETLLLGRRDVASLLSLDDCIAAVEQALRLEAAGRTLPGGALGVAAGAGGFHVKAAGLKLERGWFAAKCNANFPDNLTRFGRPTIQGLIFLHDADRGDPLAVLDSIEITILRTGAATAVAAKHLARPDTRVVTICGCGNQGRVQLRALSRVRRIERVFAFDQDPKRAERFAAEMSQEGFAVDLAPELAPALRASDACITCTTSRTHLVRARDVRSGTFVAGVGADSENKHELDPELFRGAKVVVDRLDQCAAIGDLHHALAAGTIARGAVHAELAEIVSGSKPGRASAEEITLFDSTGIALEDVAAAVVVYERALERGAGLRLDFGRG